MKSIFLVLLVFLLSFTANAQRFTISGNITDGQTGEDLLFATVAVVGTTQAVATNQYGFYALSLQTGSYTINYSYLGYETVVKTMTVTTNILQDIELMPSSIDIKEIRVVAEKRDLNITGTRMGMVGIDVREIRKLPVLMGEQDLLKTIQLMPGVSANSEGGSGYFVRGGNLDQNLVLLDEAPVYNASHLLGFFSVFNGDAIKDINLYKGTQPARYGGRASSVLDVRMKEGNKKEWEASGGLGLISSRLTVEGPIKRDEGSLIISGRRTYLDILLGTIDKDFRYLNLYFYDLNLKANYRISEKDRLFISGYLGRDVLGLEDFGFDWGNRTITARWNHIFNNSLFLNTSLIYSDYDYGFNVKDAGLDIDLDAGIYDYNAKQDYSWFPNNNNTLTFGWNAIYHQLKPALFSFNNLAGDVVQERSALEGGIYIDNDQKVSPRLRLNYGLRFSSFSNIGEYTEKVFDEEDNITSQKSYRKGHFYNNYYRLEPRFSATLILTPTSSVKASYNRNVQYLHLLSNSTAGSPTDMWLASSPLIKPTTADQISVGYFRNISDNSLKLSVETYYKKLSDIPDYEDGADTFGNPDIEAELLFGRGRAYGVEFLIEKEKGRLTGWIGYTLGKSERQIDNINRGEWFSARQDRRHDFSLVALYKAGERLTISGAWVYITGDAVTFPAGKYYIDGSLVNLYTDRNGSRMPDYHRMDIGLTWQFKERERFNSDINLSVYNAYSRKNAYSITFAEDENGSPQATRLSLFGIVPAVTWNFRF